MCGIAGFVDKKGGFPRKGREKIVGTMLKFMRHRGGDAVGVVSHDAITVGHTRLSILDNGLQANQPLVGSDSLLSFNGEIYNHTTLRNKYCKRRLASYSDTATLFELLNIWPMAKVLNRIKGMYAFSHVDKKHSRLTLALDKFAIKPIYYVETEDYFAWASEAKAFKVLPGFSFQFDETCLKEYLIFRYVMGQRTLFKDVRKLCAGECLTLSLKNLSLKKRRYYELKGRLSTKKKFSESILKSTLRAQLMSDIPVGIQLSGGLDSSLVALLAKGIMGGRPHTFSIGLEEESWNEFVYSDFIAEMLNTQHHKIVFSKSDYARLFHAITYHLDEPLVHPNTIPMYILGKEARKYTKVLLTGEGADEVFSGYNRYLKLKTYSNEEIYTSNAFSSEDDVSRILKDNKPIGSQRRSVLNSLRNIASDKKTSLYDIQTYLPHVLLRQDKAGMAANIENRVPFLYEPMVESSFGVTTRSKALGGKAPLKKIALKYFPKEFVMRKKCGFGLPIADWLKDKSALQPHLVSLKRSPFIKKYFIKKEINKLIKEHLTNVKDYSSLLFTLVALLAWHDVFLNGRSMVTPPGANRSL